MPREEWALQRTGEENEPAVADADRAEHREAVFGQTCPIETAVDVPDAVQGIRHWHHRVATNGNGCTAPKSPKQVVKANDCMWENAGNGALPPRVAGCGAMPGWMTRLRRAHSPTRSFSRTTPRPEDQPRLQADRCFPPVNPFFETTNGRVARSNPAGNRLHRI